MQPERHVLFNPGLQADLLVIEILTSRLYLFKANFDLLLQLFRFLRSKLAHVQLGNLLGVSCDGAFVLLQLPQDVLQVVSDVLKLANLVVKALAQILYQIMMTLKPFALAGAYLQHSDSHLFAELHIEVLQVLHVLHDYLAAHLKIGQFVSPDLQQLQSTLVRALDLTLCVSQFACLGCKEFVHGLNFVLDFVKNCGPIFTILLKNSAF